MYSSDKQVWSSLHIRSPWNNVVEEDGIGKTVK